MNHTPDPLDSSGPDPFAACAEAQAWAQLSPGMGWLLPSVLALLALCAAALLALPTQAATDAGAAAAAAEALHPLQWLLGVVAVGNFALSLATWHTARHKAATARLEQLEDETRRMFSLHAERLAALTAANESAITHDHLSEVYGDIKGIAAQINTLAGQQQQMNDNLRLLLARTMQV